MFLLNLDNVGDFLARYAEFSDQVYWISSPDFSTIRYISPSYEKIWGRSRQELYDNPSLWISFLHPEDTKHYHPIQNMANKIIVEGDKARYQESYRIIRPDGSIRWILDRGFPLFDEEGVCYGVTGIAIDITEIKHIEFELRTAKEAAEAASKAKSEFLSNMRHDIRTPLSGIVGFSEILKSEASEPRIKEYADNLIASSHALLGLMDEVLEAIKVSSGEIPLLKKKFSLTKTLEQVSALYAAKAGEKRLPLSLSIDPILPQYVIGDKIRIHRIVLELVGNALNFTDTGHVTIHAELAKKEQQQAVIRLTVTDTGVGIPKDKQLEIYVQFKRLTPSYQGIYKGTGLGLYVVKQFIDELGGEIYVESEPHKGTVFTCLIPLQLPLLDDASGIDSDEQLKIEKSYIAPLTNETLLLEPVLDQGLTSKVLVVEDNFIAKTVAKTLLTSMNCQVDVAMNGQLPHK